MKTLQRRGDVAALGLDGAVHELRPRHWNWLAKRLGNPLEKHGILRGGLALADIAADPGAQLEQTRTSAQVFDVVTKDLGRFNFGFCNMLVKQRNRRLRVRYAQVLCPLQDVLSAVCGSAGQRRQ